MKFPSIIFILAAVLTVSASVSDLPLSGLLPKVDSADGDVEWLYKCHTGPRSPLYSTTIHNIQELEYHAPEWCGVPASSDSAVNCIAMIKDNDLSISIWWVSHIY